VRWGGVLSSSVLLDSGLRQGSVLSPTLFSFSVNSLLLVLAASDLGCVIGLRSVNAFMYADDIILLAVSVCHMQK